MSFARGQCLWCGASWTYPYGTDVEHSCRAKRLYDALHAFATELANTNLVDPGFYYPGFNQSAEIAKREIGEALLKALEGVP